MAQGNGTRGRGPLIWVIIAIAVISAVYFLYGGLGGPDPVVEEQEGIEMREDVDAVILQEDAALDQPRPAEPTQ